MSTIKVTNLQNASAASPAIVLDANSRATLNGLSYPTEGSLSGRSRIINGSMMIDQRNAGASLSLTGTGYIYTLDRWKSVRGASGTATIQQSTTAPAGFSHSLLLTVGTGASPAASDYSTIRQEIEGYNVSDLGWGTANAKSITLSFWVRSSLTGTFGIVVANTAQTRAYATTYTISSANTFEYKTITIPGPTDGVWPTDNTSGMQINFDTGVGSTQSVAASTSWQTGNYLGVSSVTKPLATSGATFYITGVQLEAGSVATPFERRSYGQELALCQRYFKPFGVGGFGRSGSTTSIEITAMYAITMRTTPTIALGGFSGASTTIDQFGTGPVTVSAVASILGNQNGCYLYFTTSGATTAAPCAIIRGDVVSASAEL